MKRQISILGCVLGVAGCLAATAQPAAALPSRFWGVVPQAWPSSPHLQRLQRGGAGSIRLPVSWGAVQPHPRSPLDWSALDAQIAGAVAARLEPLPFLYGTPGWAVPSAPVPGTRGRVEAPRQLPVHGRAASGWAGFVRGAVERYGPRGTFWAENPALPRRPIHVWQIWNEPNFKYFVTRPNPAQYGRLVKLSARALRSRDRRAQLLLGGLFARPGEARRRLHPPQAFFATDFLDRMYRRTPGVRASFDGVALHPYTSDFRQLTPEIEEVRAVLRRHRDAGKGLWITELGWSSQRPSRANAFAKGRRGQAAQLRGAFSLLRSRQGRWRLRRVYWFSVDDQRGSCNFCAGSGLFGPGFRPKPAWRAFVRFAR